MKKPVFRLGFISISSYCARSPLARRVPPRLCVCRGSLFRKNSRHAAPRARSSRSSFTELQTDASLPNSVQWPNEILRRNGNGADRYRILCFMRCCDEKGAKCQSLLVPSAAGHKGAQGQQKTRVDAEPRGDRRPATAVYNAAPHIYMNICFSLISFRFLPCPSWRRGAAVSRFPRKSLDNGGSVQLDCRIGDIMAMYDISILLPR